MAKKGIANEVLQRQDKDGMDFSAPTDPPYPRASSAILPFCLR